MNYNKEITIHGKFLKRKMSYFIRRLTTMVKDNICDWLYNKLLQRKNLKNIYDADCKLCKKGHIVSAGSMSLLVDEQWYKHSPEQVIETLNVS